jgi:hypothetical protein
MRLRSPSLCLPLGSPATYTTLALQELNHGIANVLLDTLEKMSLDIWTLVYLLDEPPSVVRVLTAGDMEGLTTETMINYLEKLHERSQRLVP